MNGAKFNYKFGQKGNWRRTIWNRIVERLAVPPREAVVLYLAGEKDYDRQVAAGHGFRPHNLIAVERDQRVLDQIRGSRALAIKATIKDVVENWTQQDIHVVFADLCCGLNTDEVVLVKQLARNACFSRAVIAVNMMRGRESLLRADDKTRSYYKNHVFGNHRAEALRVIQRNFLFSLLGEDTIQKAAEAIKNGDNPRAIDDLGFVSSAIEMLKAEPFFTSYASTSGQIFDCGVWKNFALFKLYELSSAEPASDGEFLKTVKDCQKPEASKMTRQIAAVKATRTRYMAK